MGVIDEIRNASDLNKARKLLAGLKGSYVALLVHPEDGYLHTQNDRNRWQPVEAASGLQAVVGEVHHTGVELWGVSNELYMEFRPVDQPAIRVFVNGIEIGLIVDDEVLIGLLQKDLPGDDDAELQQILSRVGLRPL